MLKKLYHPDVKLRTIARGTPGLRDLANLINESALLAARKIKKLNYVDIEEAKDKVMMGAERRSMVMSEDEKLLIS